MTFSWSHIPGQVSQEHVKVKWGKRSKGLLSSRQDMSGTTSDKFRVLSRLQKRLRKNNVFGSRISIVLLLRY